MFSSTSSNPKEVENSKGLFLIEKIGKNTYSN